MLVGQNETCKVTDFGMARDVQQENIYERKTKVIRRGGIRFNEVGITLHNPRCGEVGIFMVSVRNAQYTYEYNIHFC